MNLEVLTYQYVSNPTGIPNAWPASVVELGDSTNLPGANWVLMTTTDYNTYISQNVAAYNTWLVANPPQSGLIFKESPYIEIVYTNTITTTSSSDTLMTNLSLIPDSGIYAVSFYGVFSISNTGKIIYPSFYKAGIQVTGTEIKISPASTTCTQPSSLVKTISFSGSDTLEVRWRVSGNTATCYNRTLTIYYLGGD